MSHPILRFASASLIVATLAGLTSGCAPEGEVTQDSSSDVTAGAKSVEQRASAYQPYLEAFHRRMLASKLDPADAPATTKNDPRAKIPIFANRGVVWELVVHEKKDYFVTTTQLLGEEWFVASAVVDLVKKNGGPYELTREEKMSVKYEDSVVSALTDRILAAANDGKNAQPDVVDDTLVKRLARSPSLFDFDRESMHGRVVTLDKKLFADVAESEHLVPGWYSVGAFED